VECRRKLPALAVLLSLRVQSVAAQGELLLLLVLLVLLLLLLLLPPPTTPSPPELQSALSSSMEEPLARSPSPSP
jgi:hypothetical protein